MLVLGAGTASWVVRTPAVRDLLEASTAQMGYVLLGISVGSMTGILSSASVVRRHGARRTIAAGGGAFVAGVAVIGLAATLSSAPGTFAGLALVGLGIGICEVALNVEGAELEAGWGRRVLPMLHGCYSLGSVVGSVLGVGLNAVALPVLWHLVGVAVLGAGVLAWAAPRIPAETGRTTHLLDAAPGWRAQLAQWRRRRIVALGLIVLALALAEGAAGDWLPLIMVDGHGVSATLGSVVFTGFAAAMALGRFAGEPLLVRFGNAAVLRAGTVVSAVGIAVVVFADNAAVAGAAVVLWGLGAALGFPVTLSAAGDSDDPTSSVAAVAVAGYLAFLVGPPLLGSIGQHVGLRAAMVVVLLAVASAGLLTSAARPRVSAAG